MQLTPNATVEATLIRRAAQRRRISAVAEFRRGTMREKVQLCDLSLGGARVRAQAPLREGLSIFLQIGTLRPIEAVIVWAAGFEAGCAFAAPLHPSTLDHLTG